MCAVRGLELYYVVSRVSLRIAAAKVPLFVPGWNQNPLLGTTTRIDSTISDTACAPPLFDSGPARLRNHRVPGGGRVRGDTETVAHGERRL